ncbi:MAG: prolyl oligopeptidase family serine peptidase [Gammaproteobacteria bacterium]|nr:prolyl oligopeptidase family serine peptidase [Gammaproteobacteria bacterium]
MIIRAILCLLAAVMISAVSAKIIDAEELFTNSSVGAMEINSNGRYVINRLREDEYSILEIYDTETKQRKEIARYDTSEKSRLGMYGWLTENKILYYAVIDGEVERFIVTIKYIKNELKHDTEQIKAQGVIVGHHFDAAGKIWFLAKVKDEVLLLKVTEEQLITNKAGEGDRYESDLDDAIAFLIDETDQPAIALVYDDRKLFVHRFDRSRKQWVEMKQVDDDDDAFEIVGTLANGKAVIISNLDRDKAVVREYDFFTGEYGDVLFENPKYDVRSATVRNGELYSVSYVDHGDIVRQFINNEAKKVDEFVASLFPGKRHNSAFNSDATKIISYVYASDDPGAFYLIDRKAGKKTLLRYGYPKLSDEKFQRTTAYSVKNNNGDDIEYFFTPGNPQYNEGVLLVMPHGGPIGVSEINLFSKEVSFFSDRGYNVLRVNFTGSYGYGREFMEKGRGQFGKQIEKDITFAVRDLEKRVSFKQKCAMGASYGGYSSIMLANYHPKEYQCVVAKYGVYDLGLLFSDHNYNQIKSNQESVEYVVGKYDESLLDVSPVYIADKLKAPVLLVAGADDYVATVEHTNRMKYMLERLEKPHDVLIYRETGHGHSSWSWERHEMYYVDDFIRTQLGLTEVGTKEQKATAAMKIADSFSFEDRVADDHKKALAFLHKAAKNDSPRAFFNLGARYFGGSGVTKNENKAIEYFKQASKLGYGSASFKLYQILSATDRTEEEQRQALQYLMAGVEQNYDKAIKRSTEIHCALETKDFSLSQCIDSLVLDMKNDSDKDIKFIAVASSLINSTKKLNQASVFKLLAEKVNFIRQPTLTVAKPEVEIKSRVARSFPKEGEVPSMLAQIGNKIKISFELKMPKGEKLTFFPLKVDWRIKQEGQSRSLFSSYKVYSNDSQYSLSYALVNQEELIAGDYELVMTDMSGKVVLSQNFTIAPVPVAETAAK